MSLTGSLSDLQISIPFFVPSAEERGARQAGVPAVRGVPGGLVLCLPPGLGRSGSPGTRGDNVR